jgi:MATE family multidrug resistance protein
MAANTTGSIDGSLRRRFLHLAWINILSNITVPLAGLVDTAMLGHLADIRFLAGVALATVLFDFLYWTLGFLRMGATGTTAQAMGRDDPTEAYQVLYRFTALGLALGTLLLVFQVPLREAGFGLLSGTPGVEAAGRDYFNARIWAAPATLCNFALVGWLLGREESRLVLVMTVAANLSNILFNYVFIVRLGLAAFGSGLATMVSQYVMLTVGVLIYFSRPSRIGFARGSVLNRHRLIEMFRLNRDILLRTLCLVGVFAVFTNFSSIMGTAMLAANSLLLRLFALAAYMIDGAAFATETLAGKLLGRRDLRGLRSLIRTSLITGTTFSALVLAAFLAAPSTFLGMLTSHRELVDLSLQYGVWMLPVLLFGALAFMYDGVFLGLTEGRRLRNAMLLSTFLAFMPPALVAVHHESPHLLWFALAAFMVARTVTLAWATRSVLATYADWSPASPTRAPNSPR